jgi:hypothetical protein
LERCKNMEGSFSLERRGIHRLPLTKKKGGHFASWWGGRLPNKSKKRHLGRTELPRQEGGDLGHDIARLNSSMSLTFPHVSGKEAL